MEESTIFCPQETYLYMKTTKVIDEKDTTCKPYKKARSLYEVI